MVIRTCKVCKREVEGEDMGDHPNWLTFLCECSNSWSENCASDVEEQLMRRAELLRDIQREG